jgi:hypothetical protein
MNLAQWSSISPAIESRLGRFEEGPSGLLWTSRELRSLRYAIPLPPRCLISISKCAGDDPGQGPNFETLTINSNTISRIESRTIRCQ